MVNDNEKARNIGNVFIADWGRKFLFYRRMKRALDKSAHNMDTGVKIWVFIKMNT
jgi:hypothetical protein